MSTAVTPAPAATAEIEVKPGAFRKLFGLLANIAGKFRHIFSVSALLVVMIWSGIELSGWKPGVFADKFFPAIIIVVMIFEIVKTTETHQLSKRAFLVDLVSGAVELGIVLVTTTILIKERRLDLTQLTNWVMFIFVLVESIFVPFNRFVLVFRQITSVTDNVSTDDHRKHQAEHGAHHEHGDAGN